MKVGDRVKVIEGYTPDGAGPKLVVGTTSVIEEISWSSGNYKLKGIGGYWAPSRFVAADTEVSQNTVKMEFGCGLSLTLDMTQPLALDVGKAALEGFAKGLKQWGSQE